MVDISNSISLGCFYWSFIIMAKIVKRTFFVMIINFASYSNPNSILCFYTILFPEKILILNTDTSVFFRNWYWYCFSILQIEYWYWYFSILKAYWILVLLFCTGQCSGKSYFLLCKNKGTEISEISEIFSKKLSM